MSVTYIPTPDNSGRIASAIDMADRYFGPQSKQIAANLLSTKLQQPGIQAASDEAKLQSEQQQDSATANDAFSSSKLPSSQFNSTIGFDPATPVAGKFWAAMTDDQRKNASALVPNIKHAATIPDAWDAQVSNRYNVASPFRSYPGGIPGMSGDDSGGGTFAPVTPSPGAAPASSVAPTALPNIGSTPVVQPLVPDGSTPPAPAAKDYSTYIPAAVGDIQKTRLLPDLQHGGMTLSPYTVPRPLTPDDEAFIEKYGAAAIGRFAGSQAKEAQDYWNNLQAEKVNPSSVEKTQAEAADAQTTKYQGTVEQRQQEAKGDAAARLIGTALPDLEWTIGGSRFGVAQPDAPGINGDGVGNFESDLPIISNHGAASTLATAPPKIAGAWKDLQSSGGAPLKPGQAEEEAKALFPMPGQGPLDHMAAGVGFGPSNKATMKGIRDFEGEYITALQNRENDPARHLPILKLPPAVRALVGPPPQRLIDNLKASGGDASEFEKSQAPVGTAAAPVPFQSIEQIKAAPSKSWLIGPDGKPYYKP